MYRSLSEYPIGTELLELTELSSSATSLCGHIPVRAAAASAAQSSQPMTGDAVSLSAEISMAPRPRTGTATSAAMPAAMAKIC